MQDKYQGSSTTTTVVTHDEKKNKTEPSSTGADDGKETKKKKEQEEDNVRLTVEFQVTPSGVEGVRHYSNNHDLVLFVRSGCDMGIVSDGATWKLDKAIESSMGFDRLNRALAADWIQISRIFIDPTCTMRLAFSSQSTQHASMGPIATGCINNGGWSLERFWLESLPSMRVFTQSTVDDINASWRLGIIQISAVNRQLDNRALPLNVEFRVTGHGAGMFQFNERHFPDYLAAGCKDRQFTENAEWRLIFALGTGMPIEYLNEMFRMGLVCVTRISRADPHSASLKLHFERKCPPTHLGALARGCAESESAWSLEQYWNSLIDRDDVKLPNINGHWKDGRIQVTGFISCPSTISPSSIVASPTTEVNKTERGHVHVGKTAQAKEGSTTLTNSPPLVVMKDHGGGISVTPVATVTAAQTTSSGIVEKDAPTIVSTKVDMKKMQLIALPSGGQLDADMIRFLANGCEGTSNVWTWDRYLQTTTSTASVSSFFKDAVAKEYLQLVPVPPRQRVGPKGIAYLRESHDLVRGPLHYFLSLCRTDNVSLDAIRQSAHESITNANSYHAIMCDKVMNHYDGLLELAIQRELIIPLV